jgi:hypothetical protein
VTITREEQDVNKQRGSFITRLALKKDEAVGDET